MKVVQEIVDVIYGAMRTPSGHRGAVAILVCGHREHISSHRAKRGRHIRCDKCTKTLQEAKRRRRAG